ncbi:DNA polymerase III subunit chi [Rhodovibrionaceae bacterium A322]
MTEIRFYHLTASRLEVALPQLLEKSLERDKRVVVMAESEESCQGLSQQLWRYRDDSFLPHGSKKEGFAEDQPIWLTSEDENPNGAQYLFLTNGALSEALADYELCALLFDGANGDLVQAARGHWRDWKEQGHKLTYWQQDDNGRWSQKASSES